MAWRAQLGVYHLCLSGADHTTGSSTSPPLGNHLPCPEAAGRHGTSSTPGIWEFPVDVPAVPLSCLHHRVCCISPPFGQLRVGDKVLLHCWKRLYLPVARCSESTAPCSPPAPSGMSLGDISHRPVAMVWVSRLCTMMKEEVCPLTGAACPDLSCCQWVAGWRRLQGMCCLDCSAGKWGTAGAGLCIPPGLQAAFHVLRGDGLPPTHRELGRWHPPCFVTSL